ncbi:MAG: hypothetical protein RR630_01970 [Coprobacillus sp.]
MRIIKVDLSKIEYTYQQYDQSLYDSILRIGFSFPLSVELKDNHYRCLDGHKRLSVLHDILIDNPDYKRGHEVCIIIKNNDNTRSNDCWRGRNSH